MRPIVCHAKSWMAGFRPPAHAETETKPSGASTAIASAVENVGRIVAELGKAELTFERLAERHNILKQPVRAREGIELNRFLKEIVGALPEHDRSHVNPRLD